MRLSNMKKTMIAAGIISLLGLTGCGDDEPKGPCLRSHDESYTQLVPAGKSIIPITHRRTVCDERGPVVDNNG